jgi:hypothetical protein
MLTLELDQRTADVLSAFIGLGAIAALVATMVICAIVWAAQPYRRCWWCLTFGLVPSFVMLLAPLVLLGVDDLRQLIELLGGFSDIRSIFLLLMAGLLLVAFFLQLVTILKHYIKLRRQPAKPQQDG